MPPGFDRASAFHAIEYADEPPQEAAPEFDVSDFSSLYRQTESTDCEVSVIR